MKKHLPLLLAATFCLFACQKKNTAFDYTNPADIALTLAPAFDSVPSQHFAFDPGEDAFFNGKKGTVIYLDQHAFVDENGKTVKGEIDLELKEVLSAAECLRAGISTLADGKLLQTAGSYYLTASQNGKTLSIDPKKNVLTSFPSYEKDPDIQFFNGEVTESGDVNWKLEADKKEEKLAFPQPPNETLSMTNWDLYRLNEFLEDVDGNYNLKGDTYYHVDDPGDAVGFHHYGKKFVNLCRKERRQILRKEKFRKKLAQANLDAWENYRQVRADWFAENPDFDKMTPYEYRIKKLGWYNLDKYPNATPVTFKGKIVDEYGNPAAIARVHLYSKKAKMHMNYVCENGEYSFSFLKGMPFEVTAFFGDKTRGKIVLDGKSSRLPDLVLKEKS